MQHFFLKKSEYALKKQLLVVTSSLQVLAWLSFSDDNRIWMLVKHEEWVS